MLLGHLVNGSIGALNGELHQVFDISVLRLVAKCFIENFDGSLRCHFTSFGATDAVNSGGAGWRDAVLAMTDGLGVDVAIEAVGVPATFEMATELIRPGGTVANVGVHGRSVELKLQDLWIKDVAITTGLVSATTTPMLLKLVAQGKLKPEKFVSHRFTFDSIMEAYDTFGRAAETKALKVAITR